MDCFARLGWLRACCRGANPKARLQPYFSQGRPNPTPKPAFSQGWDHTNGSLTGLGRALRAVFLILATLAFLKPMLA
jgi:hypothetical protein